MENEQEKRDIAQSKEDSSDQKISPLLTLKRSSSSNKYYTDDYDFWDILIDRVSVISSCRNQEIMTLSRLLNTSLTHPFLPSDTFEKLISSFQNDSSMRDGGILSQTTMTHAIPTPLKTPQTQGSIATRKGTPSLTTLTNNKHVSGTASVKLKHSSTATTTKVANTISMARELLNSMSGEIQYVEIYRRLILIPLLSFDQLDESYCAKNLNSHSSPNFNRTLKDWFEYFDRNSDGNITFQELKYALDGLNTKLSNDCLRTLFLRFQNKHDEFVDWNDFLLFYDTYINRQYVESISIDQTRENPRESDLDMINVLHEFLMKYSQLNSSYVNDKNAPAPTSTTPVTTDLLNSDDEPHVKDTNASHSVKKRTLYDDLVTLNRNDVYHNTKLVNQSGLKMSVSSMDRLSRLFDYDIINLKHFHQSIHEFFLQEKSKTMESKGKATAGTTTESSQPLGFKEFSLIFIIREMHQTLRSLLTALSSRCQTNKSETKEINFETFSLTTEEEFSKLWLTIAPNCHTTVRDDQFMSYIESVLSQHDTATTRAAKDSIAKDMSPTSPLALSSETRQRRIFCHLIRDEISYSSWNKIASGSSSDGNTSGTASSSRTISYSAFKAFVLRSHIEIIEQKLQYLVHLQNSCTKGSMSYLVHYFIPTMQEGPFRDESQLNHLMMIAYDPLSSAIFMMKVVTSSLLILILTPSFFPCFLLPVD